MPKTDDSSAKINDFLERGVVETITRDSVAKKLSSGKVLRVKHGVDPSGQELHLGHAAVYLKLRDLQNMGHKIVFLIGGFTGRFGDPTDKLSARKMKSKKEIEQNAKNYIEQLSSILDVEKMEVRQNGEWYDNLNAEDLLKLMSNFTVDQVLERSMFQERKKKNEPIQLHEIAYPVLQGYDSVMLKSDLTVIGSDQIFNESFGRDLQKKYGQEPQDIVAIKILAGLDGDQKMGKSLNNYISIREIPSEQFGKIMSIPDKLIVDYFTMLTRVPLEEIKKMSEDMQKGIVNPRDLKSRLGKEVVSFFHSAKEAEEVSENFKKTFSKGEIPEESKIVEIKEKEISLLDMVMSLDMVKSKSEARRLIMDGAVDVNGSTKLDPNEIIVVEKEITLKIGKHRFAKIKKV